MSDPLASLRLWKVALEAGEFRAIIPPRPAAAWIEFVLTGDLSDLLHSDDVDRLLDMLNDGEVDDQQIERTMYQAIEAAAGREWPMTLRLCAALYDTAVRGEVLMRMDLSVVPFAAVLDAVYAIRVRWAAKEDREAFDAELAAPAPRRPGSTDPRERMRRQRELSRERAGAIGGPSAGGRPRSRQSPEPGPQVV